MSDNLTHGSSERKDRPAAAYTEGWQGTVYRWLGRRLELLARRVRYTHRRFDLRYHVLDPLADWLVWKAVRRGLRNSRG